MTELDALRWCKEHAASIHFERGEVWVQVQTASHAVYVRQAPVFIEAVMRVAAALKDAHPEG